MKFTEKTLPAFPLTFDKCPACGSTERIAESIGEQEKAKGKIRETARFAVFTQAVIIADPTRIVISAPMLNAGYDVCMKCGAVYCTFAELTTAQPRFKGSKDFKGGLN